MDERINSLSTEVQGSVRNIEGEMSQLRQVIEDKRRAIFRSQGAFKEANTEIQKFEERVFSVEFGRGELSPAC